MSGTFNGNGNIAYGDVALCKCASATVHTKLGGGWLGGGGDEGDSGFEDGFCA